MPPKLGKRDSVLCRDHKAVLEAGLTNEDSTENYSNLKQYLMISERIIITMCFYLIQKLKILDIMAQMSKL